MAALGGLGVLLFFIVGITQAVIGYMGIEFHLGSIAAIFALVVAFFFRFMLPLTIGTFFGALDVLGWPWYLALIFTAPGLLFALPFMVAAILDGISLKKTDYY